MFHVGNFCMVFVLIYGGVLGQLVGTKFPFILDSEPSSQNISSRVCNTEQIEYRLTKLEVQTSEKSESLMLQLQEGNRKLQALESTNKEVYTQFQEMRKENGRLQVLENASEDIHITLKELRDATLKLRTIEKSGLEGTLKELQGGNEILQGLEKSVEEIRRALIETQEGNERLKAFDNITAEVRLTLEELRGGNGKLQPLETSIKEVQYALKELQDGNECLRSLEQAKEEFGTAIKEIRQGNERLLILENTTEEIRTAMKEIRQENERQQTFRNASDEVLKALKEIRQGNERLQALEKSSLEIHSAIKEIRQGNERQQPFENISAEVRTAVEEIRKGNERLQSLENANGEIRTALKDLQKERQKLQDLEKTSEEVRSTLKEILEENRTLQSLKNNSHEVHKTLQEIKGQISNFSGPISSNGVKRSPRSCKEILGKDRNSVTGLYRIQPINSPESFMVRCDMTTRGGGWTYIHNRYDGSQDFYLDRESYIKGFGNLNGEFWLGLEHIYDLTRDGTNELLVELVNENDVKKYAHYIAFRIGPNSEDYPLKQLGKYSGDAGDSLIYHVNQKFTTKDLDLDQYNKNCAEIYKGAWWHNSCYHSNLNGLYKIPGTDSPEGMNWNDLKREHSLKQARMLLREI